MLVSGGVDSTVCAALLHKALAEEQVIAVHIDNGFMRKNESLQVEQSLRKLGLKLRGMFIMELSWNVIWYVFLLRYDYKDLHSASFLNLRIDFCNCCFGLL